MKIVDERETQKATITTKDRKEQGGAEAIENYNKGSVGK